MKNFALVIEDDADLSDIFSKAVQAAGYEVESILDGALAQTRLTEVVPRLIILDLHLPHVDGITLLKQIRSTEALKDTKIIMTTADNMQAEFYREQATIVMIKPISFSQLRDISARFKIQET